MSDIDLDSIKPGMSAAEISAVAKKIHEMIPVASVTVLTPPSTEQKLNDRSAADKKIEDASAPPVCPDLNGKSPEQQKKILETHLRDKDAYMQKLLDRPAGSPYTKAEGSAMAGEILAALRADGYRTA